MRGRLQGLWVSARSSLGWGALLGTGAYSRPLVSWPRLEKGSCLFAFGFLTLVTLGFVIMGRIYFSVKL